MSHNVCTDEASTEEREVRIICGKTLVSWSDAIVYVHNKKNPRTLPTHLHFTFKGNGEALTTEVIQLAGQWTEYRNPPLHTYTPGDHEYYRARKMAIKVVETYRKKYVEKHGSPPNSLGLMHTLDARLIEKKTIQVNKKAKERITGQIEFKF